MAGKHMNTIETEVALVKKDVSYIKLAVDEIKDHIRTNDVIHGEMLKAINENRSDINTLKLQCANKCAYSEKKMESLQGQVELVSSKQSKTDNFVFKMWVKLCAVAFSGGVIGGIIGKYVMPLLTAAASKTI